MSNTQLELSAGTLRQRRNLILVTVALIFINHGQVKFGVETKLFGTSAVIGNPDFILSFLLLVQAYFLWRFYQYFHSDGAFSHLRGQFNGTLKKTMDDEVLRQIFKKVPAEVTSLSGSYSFSSLGKPKSGFYELEVEGANGDQKYLVQLPASSINRMRFPAMVGFAFRGRILTDFYLPFLLVAYSVVINVV